MRGSAELVKRSPATLQPSKQLRWKMICREPRSSPSPVEPGKIDGIHLASTTLIKRLTTSIKATRSPTSPRQTIMNSVRVTNVARKSPHSYSTTSPILALMAQLRTRQMYSRLRTNIAFVSPTLLTTRVTAYRPVQEALKAMNLPSKLLREWFLHLVAIKRRQTRMSISL